MTGDQPVAMTPAFWGYRKTPMMKSRREERAPEEEIRMEDELQRASPMRTSGGNLDGGEKTP